MERDRPMSMSSGLKPTRLVIFFSTISSSLLFLFLFSILLSHTTPSFPNPHSNLHFNATPFLKSTPPASASASASIATQKLPNSSTANFTITQLQNPPHFSKPKGVMGPSASIPLLDSVGKRVLTNASEAQVTSPTTTKSHNKVVLSECDVSSGRWVYDVSYPLYDPNLCPFIDEGFSCEVNGRPDKDYTKWRWQPYGCTLPRFNASKMLEMIRGKRLVFVGDSINRNQWESMLCLLRDAVKDPKRVLETHGRRITKGKGNYIFKFLDYQCTVEYYVTHFLVHESKGRIKQKRVQTLRIDAMDRGSSRWKGADILVFNTAHWWTHYKTKSGASSSCIACCTSASRPVDVISCSRVNYYQEGNQVHPYLDALIAFRKALTTWAAWVDRNIKPGKTKVFFRSSAPSHFRGGQWNSGGHCKDGKKPLNGTSNAQHPEKSLIVEQVIKGMRIPVTLLNITRLSELRIDGHPSIYGKKPGKDLRPTTGQDCSHWCLPGVPDTWNELLYFHLQAERR